MNLLRLGISPCPNDVYIFAGLLSGAVADPDRRFAVDFEDVETLNAAAAEGRYDTVKISYAAYPAIAERYALLECGGALGRGCGPLLLRNGPGVFDPEAETLVPGERTTANFLLDFFARQPLKKRFLPFDVLYETLRRTPGAQGVVIHEKRFTFARDGLSLLCDLGERWEDATGQAIPLGAIAVRRGAGLEAPMSRLIRRSLGWAQSHRADALALCRVHARELSEEVLASHIALYVNPYTHRLGAPGRAAVHTFLRMYRELQTVPIP